MGRYEIRKESVAPSQNALVIKWFRAKRLLCPFIVRFIVAENVSVAVVRSNAKVCHLGAAPLILDRFDKENDIGEPTPDRVRQLCGRNRIRLGFSYILRFDLYFTR